MTITYSKDETNALLLKVEQHLVADKAFSKEEFEMIHSMVNAWRGWLAMRTGIKWIVTTLGLFYVFINGSSAFLSTLKGWLIK